MNNPVPTERDYKTYSVVGRNTNCSQTPWVPHGSRPHGHDINLALWTVYGYTFPQSVEGEEEIHDHEEMEEDSSNNVTILTTRGTFIPGTVSGSSHSL